MILYLLYNNEMLITQLICHLTSVTIEEMILTIFDINIYIAWNSLVEAFTLWWSELKKNV